MRSTTTRALRENLRAAMERAARGEEILVTRGGKPYVCIVPAKPGSAPGSAHPLRGSIRHMADDFDAPIDRIWGAIAK